MLFEQPYDVKNKKLLSESAFAIYENVVKPTKEKAGFSKKFLLHHKIHCQTLLFHLPKLKIFMTN